MSVPQIYDGAFHHVAATWDRTHFEIYFDGLLVASAPSQGGILNPATTTQFRVGSTSALGDLFRFNGILDQPTVWERVLDASEIDAIHASGAGGKCTFVPVQKAKLSAAGGALLDQFGSRFRRCRWGLLRSLGRSVARSRCPGALSSVPIWTMTPDRAAARRMCSLHSMRCGLAGIDERV